MKATEKIHSTSKHAKEILRDSLGQVSLIDELSVVLSDRGAWIKFEGRGVRWFSPHQFSRISVLSQDHVLVGEFGKMPEKELLKKTAQREEVVMRLVAPTHAAGALDMPSKEGRTVLMYASMHGLNIVVEQLLVANAKPELTGTDELTALLLACGKERTTAVELLIAPTAACGALDMQGKMGHTALMLAVDKGLSSVVKRLITAGAKPEVMDKGGMTALALAWVKLRDIHVLSGAKASAAEASANIWVGCWVKTTKTLAACNMNAMKVPKDSLGKVQNFNNEHGAAFVYFNGVGVGWVSPHQFDKISVMSFDHVLVSESNKILLPEAALLKKREQREEVVMMLVAATQAAAALDVPNNEGCSVLMYASAHGLRSVTGLLLAAGATPRKQSNKLRERNTRKKGAHIEFAGVIIPEPLKEELIQQHADADLAMEALLEEVPTPSLSHTRTNTCLYDSTRLPQKGLTSCLSLQIGLATAITSLSFYFYLFLSLSLLLSLTHTLSFSLSLTHSLSLSLTHIYIHTLLHTLSLSLFCTHNLFFCFSLSRARCLSLSLFLSFSLSWALFRKYLCIYIHTHTYVHVHMHLFKVRVTFLLCTCTQTLEKIQFEELAQRRAVSNEKTKFSHAHTSTHTHANTHIHTHSLTHTHSHTNTFTHVQEQAAVSAGQKKGNRKKSLRKKAADKEKFKKVADEKELR